MNKCEQRDGIREGVSFINKSFENFDLPEITICPTMRTFAPRNLTSDKNFTIGESSATFMNLTVISDKTVVSLKVDNYSEAVFHWCDFLAAVRDR